ARAPAASGRGLRESGPPRPGNGAPAERRGAPRFPAWRSRRFTGGRLTVDERPESVVDRMRRAVDDAVATHPAARVVMIGDGIAILNYLADVLRLSPGTLRLYPPFTGVSIVRAHDGRRAVGTLFDVSHLEAMSPSPTGGGPGWGQCP